MAGNPPKIPPRHGVTGGPAGTRIGLDSDLNLNALKLQEHLGPPHGQGKSVFAHFMVGNTYPYTHDDWLKDMQLASKQAIDGFILNVGVEDWQRDRVADCFDASRKLPNRNIFKFMLCFDMTSIPGHQRQDVHHLASYLSLFSKHPRIFKHPRSQKIVISTFSGENCLFGHHKMEEGWSYLKQELSKTIPVELVPSFFMDPAHYPRVPSLNGICHWNGAWPVHLNPSLHHTEICDPKLDSDLRHLHHLGDNKSFMAAVSPWFFTHYGPNSWNKNWIYRGDDWLFVRRWEQLIRMRHRIDFVQVISWNDYGESHYIGPIKGAQPNSEAWVDGYPHEPWLHLNNYFSRAFKDGVYPTIEHDRIFVWARPHPKDAIANEEIPRPDNWELTDDLMWIVVFAKRAAIIKVYTSDSEKDIETFEVNAGMAKLSSPLKVGGGIRVTMVRDDNVVAECAPVGYRFEARPGVYNFNAFVAMSR